MDVLLKGLNTAQKDAVTSPCSVLQVLAPPGSGKTKTLTARVAYLLIHHGYAPWNIICCTFTIKASKEMRERLRALIGQNLESKLILGTFHSICRRYLVRYGNKIGLKKDFGIADSADSLAIIKRIVKRLELHIEPSTVRSRISHRKAQGRSEEELNDKQKRSVEQQEFSVVFKEYQSALDTSNLLDYDDLLLRCLELLQKHPECVSNVETVLIDEFQDTNIIQFQLMKLFASARNRITIVGDPDQSIYGFRSAEIKNLTRMQQCYPETNVILLEENYRSCAAILAAAQDVIEQDKSRPNKKLKPTHRHGTWPTFRKLPSAKAEASWLVLEVQRAIALSGKVLDYSDFAILLRSAALSRMIESVLGKAGIPYKMVGGSRFFDRKEIRILLDYMRTISQPRNNDAFMAIINVPSRKVGEKTVKDLLGTAEEKSVPLFTVVRGIAHGHQKSPKHLSKAAEQNLGELVHLVLTGREKLATCDPLKAPKVLLDFIIESLAFKDFLEKTYPEDEDNRWANVQELLAQAEDVFQEKDSNTVSEDLPVIDGIDQQSSDGGVEILAKFLANISLSSEVQSTKDDEQQGKLTISTIHAAKGLEWPVVFVPAVYEGSIPHSRAEDTDEERRLLYVAMTRAQALLYLSVPLRQSRDNEETTPSTFVTSKSQSRYFKPIAPVFDDLAIDSIVNTLGRELPTEQVIVEEMQKLRSIKDDLWPENGEAGNEEKRTWDSAGTDSQAPYRHTTVNSSFGGSSFSLATTMDRSDRLTVPCPTSQGFTTANQRLQVDLSIETKASIKNTAKMIDKPQGKTKGRDQNQGSISTFFQSGTFEQLRSQIDSPPAATIARSDDPITAKTQRRFPGKSSFKSTTSSNPSIHDWNGALHKEQSYANLPKMPEDLAHHKLSTNTVTAFKRPRPLADVDGNFRRKKHDLESSSPPPELPPTAETSTENVESTQKSSLAATTISHDGFNPAVTMHTTTMSMLQQSQNYGTGNGRKTYGVRRSMNGWADRMKR